MDGRFSFRSAGGLGNAMKGTRGVPMPDSINVQSIIDASAPKSKGLFSYLIRLSFSTIATGITVNPQWGISKGGLLNPMPLPYKLMFMRRATSKMTQFIGAAPPLQLSHVVNLFLIPGDGADNLPGQGVSLSSPAGTTNGKNQEIVFFFTTSMPGTEETPPYHFSDSGFRVLINAPGVTINPGDTVNYELDLHFDVPYS